MLNRYDDSIECFGSSIWTSDIEITMFISLIHIVWVHLEF